MVTRHVLKAIVLMHSNDTCYYGCARHADCLVTVHTECVCVMHAFNLSEVAGLLQCLRQLLAACNALSWQGTDAAKGGGLRWFAHNSCKLSQT